MCALLSSVAVATNPSSLWLTIFPRCRAKLYVLIFAIQFCAHHLNHVRRCQAANRQPCRLKYCIARSCFSAAVLVLNVPRLRRLPVFGFTLREYRRYSPDESFRIIVKRRLQLRRGEGAIGSASAPRGAAANPRPPCESLPEVACRRRRASAQVRLPPAPA